MIMPSLHFFFVCIIFSITGSRIFTDAELHVGVAPKNTFGDDNPDLCGDMFAAYMGRISVCVEDALSRRNNANGNQLETPIGNWKGVGARYERRHPEEESVWSSDSMVSNYDGTPTRTRKLRGRDLSQNPCDLCNASTDMLEYCCYICYYCMHTQDNSARRRKLQDQEDEGEEEGDRELYFSDETSSSTTTESGTTYVAAASHVTEYDESKFRDQFKLMKAIPRILEKCKALLNEECVYQAEQNAPNQPDCWSCTDPAITGEATPTWDGFLMAINVQTSIL